MSAQQVFDDKYITSVALCQLLGFTRFELWSLCKKGQLPEPIAIPDRRGCVLVTLWERDTIQPHVEQLLGSAVA